MSAASPPAFAFLLLEGHPYGREMLRQLLGRGHVPALVIEEASEVAEEECAKFLDRIRGHEVAPSVDEQLAGLDVARHRVAKHSSESVLGCIDGRPLDAIVLGGTRILRGPLLEYARHGVVNSHPGLLPECRGSASPAWSVLHDIPIGATTHFCDEGIDTGDILLRRELPVRRGMAYEDLCHGTLVLAGELMAEAMDALVRGEWERMRAPQGDSPWPTFRNAPPEVVEEVRRKLADHQYPFYSN